MRGRRATVVRKTLLLMTKRTRHRRRRWRRRFWKDSGKPIQKKKAITTVLNEILSIVQRIFFVYIFVIYLLPPTPCSISFLQESLDCNQSIYSANRITLKKSELCWRRLFASFAYSERCGFYAFSLVSFLTSCCMYWTKTNLLLLFCFCWLKSKPIDVIFLLFFFYHNKVQ